MNKCSIIIGSMWGDEGKGHITDILSQENNTLKSERVFVTWLVAVMRFGFQQPL